MMHTLSTMYYALTIDENRALYLSLYGISLFVMVMGLSYLLIFQSDMIINKLQLHEGFTKWKKIAVVSDQSGVEKFTDFFSVLVPGEAKGFKPEELEEAKQWIQLRITN
ncbi:STAS/SEC14 domain-containing protein [Ferruginibacter sp. HRS2-29]|nr:STAS/SEC14 domain-containing protein [Ferruginibacter sp. HRS2-29]